jgi:hypothetical protein
MFGNGNGIQNTKYNSIIIETVLMLDKSNSSIIDNFLYIGCNVINGEIPTHDRYK